MRTLMLAVMVVGPLAGATLPARQHQLGDVLARAAAYHADHVRKVSGVSLDEQTQLMDVSAGRTRSVVRISSDVVLVLLNGQVLAMRDPYAVDTRPLREPEQRILKLLGAPARPSMRDWQTADGFRSQSRTYFRLDIVVKVNQPTSALQFIAAVNQPGLKYKLDGRKTMNGVSVVGVRFEEPELRGHEYMLRTRLNARATGRFWIDPATGAIHQTELWVESRADRPSGERAIVSVKYAPNDALDLLLPSEMNDSYEEHEERADGERLSASVQSRALYSNPTFAAIDLTKLR